MAKGTGCMWNAEGECCIIIDNATTLIEEVQAKQKERTDKTIELFQSMQPKDKLLVTML